MVEHDGSNDSSAPNGRALTYDETKAAEAAFRGDPFNPHWSAAAAQVYAGIAAALTKRESKPLEHTAAEDDRDYIHC
jgi:hypothetical protein